MEQIRYGGRKGISVKENIAKKTRKVYLRRLKKVHPRRLASSHPTRLSEAKDLGKGKSAKWKRMVY